ncbi:MAG: PKD domain-containing protein [Bacteroidetes bacterium]|nr:PKD domain-containing protein [Bacteroidota bacterium]
MKKFLFGLFILGFLLISPTWVQAQLTANFTATTHSGCAPVQVTFTDASTGNPASYLWDFGIGSPVSTKGPHLKTYTTPGNYVVSLTVTDANGTITSVKLDTIHVYGKPSIQTVSANLTSGCVPLNNVQFSGAALSGAPAGAAQGLSWYWDFGDGSSPSNATAQNPMHNYTVAGTFNITLTVTNAAGCQQDSTRKLYMNVYPLPQPSFTVSPNNYACGAPATLNFTNTSTGATPSRAGWTFGDGSGKFTGNTIVHTYAGTGSYIVTMHDTDGHGCVSVNPAYATRTVTVYPDQPAFSFSPSKACVNQAVYFTDNSPGMFFTDWDYGDGVKDQSGVHAYTSSGTFQVKMTSHIGLYCTSTLTKNITVNAAPAIQVTHSPSVPCPAPTTVTFTASAPGSSSSTQYSWSFDGTPFGSNSNATQSYTFTASGYRHFQVTALDPVTGCTSTLTENSFPIYPIIPEFEHPKDEENMGCIPFSPEFELSLKTTLPPIPPPAPLPPYPVAIDSSTFQWTFYNGSATPGSSTLPGGHLYTWNSVGTYKVVVSGMTKNGCPFTDTISVHADTPTVPSYTVSPLTNCPKVPFTFVNTTANDTGTTYQWVLGDTTFNVGPWIAGFNHSYKIPGRYFPKLITNHHGCIATYTDPDSPNQVAVVVNPSNANFRYDIVCGTYKVQFSDLSIGAHTWHWDFGDGDTSNVQNPKHTYAANGTYQVHLHTSNFTYGCSDDTILAVNVFNVASALSFSADKDTFCVGDRVHFIASFPGPTIAPTFSWQVDNGPQSLFTSKADTFIIFPTRGQHKVKLYTIYDSSCTSFVVDSSFLAAQPIVGFLASNHLDCTPVSVNYSDTSKAVPGTTIYSRSWDFGDTTFNFGNNKNVTHQYLNRGLKSPLLIVTDNIGCKDSLHQYGMIDARHTVDSFTVSDTLVCTNDTVRFKNYTIGDSATLQYRWDFGDGYTSNLRNPNHAFNLPGTYHVRLIAFDNVPCADTFYVNVRAKGPIASFTKDKSISTCKAMQVHFTNTSQNAISYVWDMGDGVTLPTTPSVYTYGTPGKYIITLRATDAEGCTSYALDSVFLLGYRGSFSFTPTTLCLGDTVHFKAAVNNIPTINWDFGDGTGATAHLSADTFHVYTSGGSFSPIVIYDAGEGCGKAFDSGIVPVQVEELKANFSTTVPCVGVPFSLRSTSTAQFSTPNSWHWKLSASDTANGTNTSYLVNQSGPHPVTLHVTSSLGCKDSITKNVFINPLPFIDAGPADTGICPGDTIRLTGHGGVSYIWSPDSLVSCTHCTVTLVSSARPTQYFVVGTDSNGCVNRDSITARIQIQTTANVLPGGDICIGESFRLHASGATIYKWQPERFLDSPDIASPLATPIITTHYVVMAKEGTCLERYDTVTVVVHPTPYFDAGDDQFINYGSSVTLNPTEKGIARIEWRPDTTLSCFDCFHPVAHPSFTTIYYAKGYSEYGCVDSDSVVVRVRCNGDSVFIPNSFTPNGDGLNDVFFPRGKGISYISSMRIFNRWGELVFERYNFPLNDEKSGWDGSYKGSKLPPDVFMYTIQTRCATGEPLLWKGDVTILR